ncbi:uncharacterized protein LOC131939385 [Physella acuta]|uniref:uncharacterized protein LOC131939385 n=1 Tax=Physella acuta TaxID=109671 RepID=UPI0027DD4F14|nr:uncharacterized protein LOC131939385 [Physella acuta]
MYNTSNIKLHLNGKLLPSLTVVYEMNDYKGENQICCLDSPSPCVVELVTQHGDVSTGDTCVSFNVTQTRYTEDIRLTIKYNVCNVREGELTLQFRSHAITESPEIILNSYEPEDAQPVCKEGLRHDVDKLVFKARAYLTHKSWRVKFIVKRNGEKLFLDFCNVSLSNDNDHSTKDRCYHADTDSNGTHHIVVNLTADIQYSEAQIQGVLVGGTSSIFSQVQTFPKIFDTSSINYTINGRPVSTLQDDLELTTPLDDLRVCCGVTPLPCRARINYGQLEMAHTPCVNTTLGAISNHDNVTLELGFDVCGVSEKNLRVNIQKWRDTSTEGNNARSFNYTEDTNYTVSYEETLTNTPQKTSFTLATFHLIIAATALLVPISVVSLLVYCVQVKQTCRKISANGSRYSVLFLPSSRPVRQERESLHIYESIDDTPPRHTTQVQHVSMRKRMAKDDSYRNLGTDYFDSEECLYDRQRRLPPMTVLHKRMSRSMDDVGYLAPIDFHHSYSRSLPRIPK